MGGTYLYQTEKERYGMVRFISDFRELNTRLKRKPFPLPKTQDLMLKLEGFQYATSLEDLNMGYYHIELNLLAQEMCTIALPWGKYRYKRLPMEVADLPQYFPRENVRSNDWTGICPNILRRCASTYTQYVGRPPAYGG